MDELKRQLMEAVAALDAHDAEMEHIMRNEVHGPAYWAGRAATREVLVLSVAGVARTMVNLWKTEDATATPCGAEFAGHVCGTKGAHVMHEDAWTGQRWPVTP